MKKNNFFISEYIDSEKTFKAIKYNEQILKNELFNIINIYFKFIVHFNYFSFYEKKIKEQIFNSYERKVVSILFDDIDFEKINKFFIKIQAFPTSISVIFPLKSEKEKYYNIFDYNNERDLSKESFNKIIGKFISNNTKSIVFLSELKNHFLHNKNFSIEKLNKFKTFSYSLSEYK